MDESSFEFVMMYVDESLVNFIFFVVYKKVGFLVFFIVLGCVSYNEGSLGYLVFRYFSYYFIIEMWD